jgi:hypothetical protein
MQSSLYFLAFFFLLTTSVYGQKFPSDKQADAFVQSLQKQKTDAICTLKHDCIGCMYITEKNNTCEDKEDETYIFWKQKGKTYLTKKDNCKTYPIIEIKKEDFWNFYFKNQATIASEKIKWPEYIVQKEDGEHLYGQSISHYGFDNIVMYTDNNPQPLDHLPDYYFDKNVKGGDKEYQNINYEYNTNSFTNQLRNKLTILIDKNKEKLEAIK